MGWFFGWPGAARPRPDPSGVPALAEELLEGVQFFRWDLGAFHVTCGVEAVSETKSADEPAGAHFACAVPVNSFGDALVCKMCRPGLRLEDSTQFRR